MSQRKIEALWLDSALDVAYQFDDAIIIKSGERAGEKGRIIALFGLEPDPHYMIEFADGSSIVALESDLERAA